MLSKSFSGFVVAVLLSTIATPCRAQNPAPTADCQFPPVVPSVIASEGLAEFTGNIIVQCTYTGPIVAVGSPPPTVDISIAFNTTVTSRIFGGGTTEAMLFIDDPPPQNWYVNTNPTAPNTAGCTASPTCPNVFSGKLNSPNSVLFAGVPLAVPVAGTAPTRYFRLANLRVNTTQLRPGAFIPNELPIIATISVTSPQFPGLRSSAAPTVGLVQSFLSFSVRSPVSFTASQGYVGPAVQTSFIENFAPSFKKRNCAISAAIPRFADPDAGRSNMFTIESCRTNLLWPFLSGGNEFTDGVVLPDRTADPFCTPEQTGPCTLNYYGATASGTRLNSTYKGLPPEGRFFVSTRNLSSGPGHAAYLMTPGGAPAVDQGNGFTPLEQVCPDYKSTSNCTASWQIIDSDPTAIETFIFQLDYSRPPGPPQASTVIVTATPSIGPNPTFQEYILAKANFNYAHGYGFISDSGAQRLAQGYLSLILPDAGVRAEAENRVGAFEVRGENVSQLRPAEVRVAVHPEGKEQAANTLFFNLTSEGYLQQRLVLGSFGTTRLGNFTVTIELDPFAGQVAGKSWLKAETIGTQTPVTLVISVDPEGLAPGTYKGRITATPAQAATGVVLPVELVVPPPGPRVRTIGVASAGSYANSVVAPGEAIVIFGAGFGPPALAGLELANGVVSTNIGRTRILFDGEAAPMIYSVANQASCFVPFSVEGKKFVEVVVEYQGVASPPARLAVLPSKPALLTANASGSGIGAILTQDYTPNAVKPAQPGEFVVLFGVGGGQTIPPSVGGRLQMGIGAMKVPVRAFLDGVEIMPLYAGPAPDLVEGVFQVNLPIPANVRRNAKLPVELRFGTDVHTQPGVTVWVE